MLYICIMNETHKIQAQLTVLERKFATIQPVNGNGDHNREYYSLKGKIGKLKKQLDESKKQDWLGQ